MTRNLMAAALVACLAIVAGSVPGSASPAVEWSDAPGDANGLPEVESTPRPSDPELDVLKASLVHKGDSLIASLSLERVGTAPGSFGSVYRWYFTLKDAEYYFQARTNIPEYPYKSDPGFYQVDPLGVEDVALKCDCKSLFDSKNKLVTFAIKWAGFKKTLNAGGDLTKLYAKTWRRYTLFVDGDTARAPEKATFKV